MSRLASLRAKFSALTVWGKAKLVLAFLLACLALWMAYVAYYRIFVAPGNAAVQATEAKVDSVVAKGQVQAGQVAQEATVKHFETTRIIERRVDQGVRHVYAAKGGDVPISTDLGAAGRAALCMSRSYQSANDCYQHRLLENGGAFDPETGAFSGGTEGR